MDIGTGIAIAGVWVSAGMIGFHGSMGWAGFLIAQTVAILATWALF